MRPFLQPVLFLVSMAGALACGGVAAGGGGSGGAGGSGADVPACHDGFAEQAWERYGYDPRGGCFAMAYATGVGVRLPPAPRDRDWVLSGTVGDEPFTCTYLPGMVEGDPCGDNPRVEWRPTEEGSPSLVWLGAHPCRLSLRLEVDGEQVASASFEPDYEWSEPNGVGCGWAGVAFVVLSSDQG